LAKGEVIKKIYDLSQHQGNLADASRPEAQSAFLQVATL
jgi:hypothetical protein